MSWPSGTVTIFMDVECSLGCRKISGPVIQMRSMNVILRQRVTAVHNGQLNRKGQSHPVFVTVVLCAPVPTCRPLPCEWALRLHSFPMKLVFLFMCTWQRWVGCMEDNLEESVLLPLWVLGIKPRSWGLVALSPSRTQFLLGGCLQCTASTQDIWRFNNQCFPGTCSANKNFTVNSDSDFLLPLNL